MYETNAQLLNNVISNVESDMLALNNISNYVIFNTIIQENLIYLIDNKNSKKQAVAKRNVYEALYTYMFSNSYIKSISLVTDDTIITLGNSFTSDKIDLEQINQKPIDDAGRVSWSSGASANYSMLCTREIRQLKFLKLRKLAILYIDVDMDQIISDALIDAGYTPDLVEFIVCQGNEQIYPNETSP
ncbi:MAG: hypothetical protein ACERKZ_19185 [Lachnotalea sp.]